MQPYLWQFFVMAFAGWVNRVLSKNTNELEICVPGRFGLEVAGCYVSTIGKPHEYFDLTVRRHKPVSLAGASPA